MTRCLQQIEKQLSLCNIKIASLTSTIGSKTVIDIVKSITNGNYQTEELLALVHGRVKNRHGQKVRQSLEGIIDEHDIFLLNQIYADHQHVESQCNELLAQAEKLADQHYKEQVDLLQSMPGIKKLSATIIWAELGGNISLFQDASHLTGWCGLRPKNERSADKIITRAIGKGNKYLRRILVQTAWAASRTKNCYLKNKFEQLVIRKGNKKALIAIARKQLVIIYHMLSKNEGYKEPKVVLSEKQIQRKKKYHEGKLNNLNKELEKVG
jgi:transposase